ncbi:hypothetical protein PMAYCL1PPCAC_10637, partial [Pristionchus mayeri]
IQDGRPDQFVHRYLFRSVKWRSGHLRRLPRERFCGNRRYPAHGPDVPYRFSPVLHVLQGQLQHNQHGLL